MPSFFYYRFLLLPSGEDIMFYIASNDDNHPSFDLSTIAYYL